ncbi:MAG: ATP synthase F1 subunit delta [Myxococcota bacterium]
MATDRSQQAAVARVWADALVELAAAAKSEDELLDELTSLVELLDGNADLDRMLSSPLVDDEAKRALLEKALRGRASDLLVDALQVLRRKGRLGLVRAVATAYREEWMRRRNRVEVKVTSAIALSDDVRQEIRLAAAERTNQHPVLVERVDPALLGGLVVEIGDDKFDSSVARSLARLEEALLARASSELLSGKSYFTAAP